MPPRAVKKQVAAPGPKRTPRATKSTPKSQPKPEVTEEPAKVEESPASVVEVKQEIKVEAIFEEKSEEKPSEPEPEKKSVANGSVSVKVEDDQKESYDEDDKGERLDLDDNEPEYEPEEDGGVDYDEREIEVGDVEENGDEGEEQDEEGDVGEEEELVEEEIEDVEEELEGEEDVDNAEAAEEEHEEMRDADDEEHHEVFQERRKRKEFEVFVGGLDKDATEDDLKKVFCEVGVVTEVRLMMNPLTKKNKGFAFLRFATVEQAKKAVTELKNPVVKGKQCGVSPSQDTDTLFLGNICKTWTKEALKEKLKYYGVEDVEDLTLVEDSNNEGMNRGFAFLEFSCRSDAMEAFKCLQKRDVVFGVDRTAKVSFADSFIEPDDEIMAQVKTVFVDGVPASWDEDRVQEYLKKFGVIEKIELARNMPSAKRKDFGFVTFNTHDAAVACAEAINNAELGEGANKAKVRARLSRPHQKGRGKHARGDFRLARGVSRGLRGSRGYPVTRSFPGRGARGFGGRVPQATGRGLKRPIAVRDRRPVIGVPGRARPLPPMERSYGRRVPVPPYPKSSLKRDYDRHEFPPRNRAVLEHGSRVVSERRASFRDEYPSRGSVYSDDVPRSIAHSAARRDYIDEGYGRRFERPPPPSYREGRPRDYDSISGSKRPYSALDDAPRYADAGVRQSRARMDYGIGGSASQYGDAYNDRLGRSHVGYGSSRNSLSSQDSHVIYSSRQGMSYGGGNYGGSDVGGMYSSSYGSDYMSRGPDVGGRSYSSLYSGRSLGSSGYLGGSGSGSYY